METKERTLSSIHTVEELHKGLLEEVPNTSGVYFVFMPADFELIICLKMLDLNLLLSENHLLMGWLSLK